MWSILYILKWSKLYIFKLTFIYTYLDFSKEQDLKYKSLLESEYRYIKSIQGKIIKNASLVYKIKTSEKINSLTKRCNDFKLLEEKCRLYK